jgi:cell division septation protein DedD
MTKDNAFRELKFSPPQLVIVFLAILVLGIFVFLLGISVGKKQPQLLAQAGRASAPKTESVAAPAVKPAEVTTSVAPEEPKAKLETAPVAGQTQLPQARTESKPALPADKKPASAGLDKKPAAIKTAPEVKKPSAPPTSGFQNAPYYVQVSASEDKAAAAAYAKKIADLGYPTIVLDPFGTDKRPVYRVRVGPFESKQDATAGQGKLATALKKKKTDFFIVKG